MKKWDERFFFVMAILLIAIVFTGFGAFTLRRSESPFDMPLILHIHGVVFLSWYVLLVTQTRLISGGNVKLHMHLGTTSVGLAVAMVVLGYFVTRHAFARPDWSIAGLSHDASAMFPFMDILLFPIVYGLGIANRHTPAAHKRLMILAGIIIIDPAMARLIFATGAPAPLILVLEMALPLLLVAYDFVALKRPHWASLLGVSLMAVSLTAKMTAPMWPWWPGFANWMFGGGD